MSSINKSDKQEIIEKCKQAVRDAGALILNYYEQPFLKAKKKEFPITEVDLAADKMLKEKLHNILDIPILSEEENLNDDHIDSDRAFIIDPLDGTKDFVHKMGDFAIMVALVELGRPTMGFVYKPVDDILYWAAKGQGAFQEKNNKVIKLQVSKESNFKKMKLLTSRYHLKQAEITLKEKLNLDDSEKMGSAGLKMCGVASGRGHIYLNSSDKTGEWDSAPGIIIVEEAGGIATDIYGEQLEFLKKNPRNEKGFIISNGTQHATIVSELQKVLANL